MQILIEHYEWKSFDIEENESSEEKFDQWNRNFK